MRPRIVPFYLPGEMGKPYKVDKEKADNKTKAKIDG